MAISSVGGDSGVDSGAAAALAEQQAEAARQAAAAAAAAAAEAARQAAEAAAAAQAARAKAAAGTDGKSTFDANAKATADAPAATAAPAPAEPRTGDIFPLSGGHLTPTELTPLAQKIDTIVAVSPEAEQARVRDFLQNKADLASVDRAYGQVLDAAKGPGVKNVDLQLDAPAMNVGVGEGMVAQPMESLSVKAHLEVGADFKVNGGALPGDAALKVGVGVAQLDDATRRDALKQVGVSDAWLKDASPTDVQQALTQVEVARQTPGKKELDLSRITRTAESRSEVDPNGWGGGGDNGPAMKTINEIKTSRVEGKVSFDVGPKGEVNGQPSKVAAGLVAVLKRETAEWPNGKPESYVKTKCDPKPGVEPTSLANGTTRQGKIDTILAVLPDAAKADFKQLLADGGAAKLNEGKKTWEPQAGAGGITDDQLDKAFRSVLDARNTPGQKTLSLELTPFTNQQVGNGENVSTVATDGKPVKFSVAMNVSADGKVNGAELPADLHARLSTELSHVPGEFKDTTLKEAGLSEAWVGQATPLEKDYALAKLREASMTPGAKEFDFSFSRTSYGGGDSGQTYTTDIPGKVKLDVAADGKVNGKQLTIETALATTLQMDKLSMADKRSMMASLGFDAEGQRNVNPEQATSIMTRAAMATRTPGDHTLEVQVGGDKYGLSLKVGQNGKLEGAGAAKIPPPPEKSWWQTAASVVLTVVGFAFPLAAPVCNVLNGALSVYNGIKNHSLLGAIGGALGVGGELAGMAGNLGLANTLGQAASVAGAANGLVNAVKTGDIAGLISSAISTAGAVGTLAGTPISSDLANLGQAVRAGSGVVNAIKTGDLSGLISAGTSAASAIGNLTGNPMSDTVKQTLGTVSTVVGIGQSLASGDYGSALGDIVDMVKDRFKPATSTGDASEAGTTSQAPATPVDSSPAVDATDGTDGTDATDAAEGADGTAEPATSTPTTTTGAAAASTPKEIAADFDRAFAAARKAGESTFEFDKQDGRGPQLYTTELRGTSGASTSTPAATTAAPVAPTKAEQQAALAARGRELIADPSLIRTPEDTAAVQAALKGSTRPDGRPVGGPITFADHVAMVKSVEVLAAGMPPNELATQLRQRFYPDDNVFMNIGRDNQAPLPPAARAFLDSIPSGDQDVRLKDGKLADLSHALVGFDAVSNGMPIKAQIYTNVGDAIQGVVSLVGGNASGNFNASDARGNNWGFVMGDLIKQRGSLPLSDLLRLGADAIAKKP